MTRKDYLMLAAALKRARDNTPQDNHIGVEVAASNIAHTIAEGNPSFDVERFLRNAGVPRHE